MTRRGPSHLSIPFSKGMLELNSTDPRLNPAVKCQSSGVLLVPAYHIIAISILDFPQSSNPHTH
ncbi:hypothetical protein SESBI_01579 [Sesbania bispinosa]|nr:hypothetical protein SESBI_09402 [Sesbania bispinosa]KAJ1441432.1 hypothetical protein SESBI_01579 [Sesbania bispinosa]